MEFLLSLIPFVGEFVAVASIVAAVTPTPKDDAFLGKLYRVVDFAALNVGRAKDKAPRTRPLRKK